jgi:hypothetical protein
MLYRNYHDLTIPATLPRSEDVIQETPLLEHSRPIARSPVRADRTDHGRGLRETWRYPLSLETRTTTSPVFVNLSAWPIQDNQQSVRTGADGFGELALQRVEVAVEQEVGHADDAVHGRPDLMAHVREELAFCAVCRFGGQVSVIQPHFGTFLLCDFGYHRADSFRLFSAGRNAPLLTSACVESR